MAVAESAEGTVPVERVPAQVLDLDQAQGSDAADLDQRSGKASQSCCYPVLTVALRFVR